MKLKPLLIVAIFAISIIAAIPTVHTTTAFSPKMDDFFNYDEVVTVNNGTGGYLGYADQTVYNGTEVVTGVNGDIVSMTYTSNYNYSSNQFTNTTSGTQSGPFAINSSSLLYLNGTDGQTGYTNPNVWFAMDNTLPVGSSFYLLDSLFTVTSTNASYYVPTMNETVETIAAVGTGSYQRNDSYGLFSASYIWNAYFDPASGYIVGYNYVEQDTNPNSTFTETDNLYISSSSYPLTVTSAPATTSVPLVTTSFSSSSAAGVAGISYTDVIIGVVILGLLIALIAFALSRRGRRPPDIPRHPYSSAPPSIDLTPKSQPPVQQVVIKEVAMIPCAYCGALMESTAKVCPRCGAPRV